MTTHSNCPNCNAPLDGPFCSKCGQNQKDFKRFFLSLINEAFDGVFSFDSRAWKTLLSLLLKPGLLSVEFYNGRRASYVAPLRLYLITSVAFFLILSIGNFIDRFDQDSTPIVIQSTEVDDKTITEEKALNKAALAEGLSNLNLDQGQELDFSIPFVSDATEEKIKALFKQKLVIASEDPGQLTESFLDVAPPVIFILLPLFALLLKLLYLFKGVYYSEHLIFSLHINSFAFLILILFSASNLVIGQVPYLGATVSTALLVWSPNP